MSPLFSHNRPSNRQIAKDGRNQFESLAIKAAHGDTDAVQALPAAATQARDYYRNDKEYLDQAWAVMTVALRDVLTDDVLTEQKETDIAKLSFALGIQQRGVDVAHQELRAVRGGHGGTDQRRTSHTRRQRAPHDAARETAFYPTFGVALMKEVVDREMRGGSSGVSVRIAKGVKLPRRSGTCPQCCHRHAPGGPRFWTTS